MTSDLNRSAAICHVSPFSMQRVAMLWGYYSPLIRRQLTVYITFSAICAILLLIPARDYVRTAFFTLVWGVIPMLAMLAPVALGKLGYAQNTDRQLPAKAPEKLTFFFFYFLAVVPLAVFLLPILAEYACLTVAWLQSPAINRLTEIQLHTGYIPMLMNLIGGIGAIFGCLYVVNRARSGKVLWGVVTVLGIQFAEGILGAIVGMSAVFRKGFEDGMSGEKMSDEELVDFTIQALQPSPVTWAAISILILFVAAMIVANYRWLRLKK